MRRLLALLALAASATLALAAPAGAGGPTSVLVTDPATGQAAALYYSDPRYEQLDLLLADAASLDGEPAGLGGRALNLTWMIHDVQPWRTQQLFPDAEGGPVVASYGSELTGDPGTTTWSRPSAAKELLLLADGILAPARAPASAADPAAAPTVADPVVTERVVRETRWFSLTGWRWLVPGLLLGVAGSLLLRRGRARSTERRQVLVDVAP
jgi:hypothetical protein